MIGVRLSDDYERRFAELARKAGMKPGPFARRILMAYVESNRGGDATVDGKLRRIEEHIPKLARLMLRLERKVDAFLDNAELVDH